MTASTSFYNTSSRCRESIAITARTGNLICSTHVEKGAFLSLPFRIKASDCYIVCLLSSRRGKRNLVNKQLKNILHKYNEVIPIFPIFKTKYRFFDFIRFENGKCIFLFNSRRNKFVVHVLNKY